MGNRWMAGQPACQPLHNALMQCVQDICLLSVPTMAVSSGTL